MSGVALRTARSTDAGTVGAILSEFTDTTPWMPRLHSRAEDIGFVGAMIDRGWITVAETGGRITGFAAREGEVIHALYVMASARRSGIGSALLRRLMAGADRLELWTFEANAGAQAFYIAHGFLICERTDGAGNDERLPDLRFEWKREGA